MKVVERRDISLESGLEIAKKAIEIGSEMNHNICVTIVDSSGCVVVVLKSDKANYITPNSSRKKAKTACATGIPTQKFLQIMKDKPEFSEFSEIDEEIVVYGGGVPIKVDGEVVGAIGIAGAPGGEIDDRIANETLATYKK